MPAAGFPVDRASRTGSIIPGDGHDWLQVSVQACSGVMFLTKTAVLGVGDFGFPDHKAFGQFHGVEGFIRLPSGLPSGCTHIEPDRPSIGTIRILSPNLVSTLFREFLTEHVGCPFEGDVQTC